MLKDREAWHAAVQGIRESDMTERSDKKIIFLVTKCPFESLTFVLFLFLFFIFFKFKNL